MKSLEYEAICDCIRFDNEIIELEYNRAFILGIFQHFAEVYNFDSFVDTHISMQTYQKYYQDIYLKYYDDDKVIIDDIMEISNEITRD